MGQSARELRVILAEDNASFREAVRQVLSASPGCRLVGETANGSEVVKLALDQDADVVLLDVGMPGMNGLEVARDLRSLAPGIKVVLLLTHDRTAYQQAAAGCGATWVVKDRLAEELPPLLAHRLGGDM